MAARQASSETTVSTATVAITPAVTSVRCRLRARSGGAAGTTGAAGGVAGMTAGLSLGLARGRRKPLSSNVMAHPETGGYDPQDVERKWQQRWEERGTNHADLAGAQRPFFNLMMFPYPSAEGLHVGNVFAFVGADIQGRFQRLQGLDVFEPMGFDAFGIHSENFALKVGIHPAELIPRNIARFRTPAAAHRPDGRLALRGADHRSRATTSGRSGSSCSSTSAGLAVSGGRAVNWCPTCKTVLANEQVIDGYCERHPDVKVEQRMLEQWFFTITQVRRSACSTTSRLARLVGLDRAPSSELDRPLRRRGAGLRARRGRPARSRVFTTRPDTLFGATYLVLAPEHPLVADLTTRGAARGRRGVPRAGVAAMDLVSRKVGDKEKTGVFTGAYARQPGHRRARSRSGSPTTC